MAGGKEGEAMIVTVVEVYVQEAHIEDFKKATIENHQASIQEPGNLRFDILQSIDDPTRFTLYEAYESEEAAAEHKKTAHYLKWREMVEDWMAKPRKGIPHKVIVPEERNKW
ncbi:antibiotic biosynthesis monooxygenase [Petroclostridium xylanilyticum]|uniref:antibiotic biosynthesis monooxygenase n=1 Tax=Petroclostridium xylanilyticum TaxID=1792311 RepID=UPI001FA87493|nr:antibiotic biosynthesis monooxygenase [Petroclostridium xylanilyticum]